MGRPPPIRRKPAMDPALCQARKMVRDIVALTESFPREHRRGMGYWHMHVPVNQKLIDGSRARKTVRRLCIQTLIDRAYHLWTLKPRQLQKSKVVAAIDLPKLFDSQIIIFFSEEYYARFFDRNTKEQRWKLLPPSRDFQCEWKITIPSPFCHRGYRETIEDDGYHHEGEVWFIGEL